MRDEAEGRSKCKPRHLLQTAGLSILFELGDAEGRSAFFLFFCY